MADETVVPDVLEPAPANEDVATRPSWEQVCRPDLGRVCDARIWAVLLVVLASFSAVPAFRCGSLAQAPDWARWVLFVAALQLLYAAWMAAVPDWSSMFVMGVVNGAVAVLYAATAYAIASAPAETHLPWELDPLRRAAPLWCTAVSLSMGLSSYLSFRSAVRWHRAWLEKWRIFSGRVSR